jgi:hypothetical protein
MMQEKSPADIALVAREKGQEPSAQITCHAIGESRQLRRCGLEQQLAGARLSNVPLRYLQRG